MPEWVLVTGASGFIAGHCVTQLADHGYAVRGTVRRPGQADHLRDAAELVTADLDSDDGWADAVAGCTYVLHVASPFPSQAPADESGSSGQPSKEHCGSFARAPRAAQSNGWCSHPRSRRSARVILPPGRSPKTTGRTLAAVARTRRARRWPNGRRGISSTPMASSNWPSSIRGWCWGRSSAPQPILRLEPVRRLLARQVPGIPRLGWATVDVRDLAVAHRLAMEVPDAEGNRDTSAGEHVWMRDMAEILVTKYRVPTRAVPYWLMWVIARFDPTVRMAPNSVGQREVVSADKARRELGWTMRPLDQTILDTARSLIDHHVVSA